MRVRWSRSLSVEGCMVGVDVVVQDVVAAGVVGRFGGGCPMTPDRSVHRHRTHSWVPAETYKKRLPQSFDSL